MGQLDRRIRNNATAQHSRPCATVISIEELGRYDTLSLQYIVIVTTLGSERSTGTSESVRAMKPMIGFAFNVPIITDDKVGMIARYQTSSCHTLSFHGACVRSVRNFDLVYGYSVQGSLFGLAIDFPNGSVHANDAMRRLTTTTDYNILQRTVGHN